MIHLEAKRIVVRDHVWADLTAVHAWHSDPKVMEFVASGPATSREQSLSMLADCIGDQTNLERERFWLAIVLKVTNALIGRVDLYSPYPNHEAGEGGLGWFVNREHWGCGYATEAARLVIDLGFAELGMHRIYASCLAKNVGSERIMRKCGMTKEAHHRCHTMLAGEWVDRVGYAILRDEWEAGAV